jgi:hypothetical protein
MGDPKFKHQCHQKTFFMQIIPQVTLEKHQFRLVASTATTIYHVPHRDSWSFVLAGMQGILFSFCFSQSPTVLNSDPGILLSLYACGRVMERKMDDRQKETT